MINVLFFAQLADLAACDSIEVEFTEGMSARSMLASLADRLPAEIVDYLTHDVCMLSVNKQMSDWDIPLCDNDEVAFLPPFSGG